LTVRNFTDLTGRVAVVIGGSSGIGRTIALGLAQAGADVVPSARRADAIEKVCGDIEKLGHRTLRRTSDVANRDALEALRDATLGEFGHIDILVNAAGITMRCPTATMAESDWARIMETNLTGTLRACQVFYDPLRANGRGRIINIASLASFVAFLEVAAYSASKAALLSLTRSLGSEWSTHGINVNAIAPGIFPTDLNAHLLTGTDRGVELLLRTPMNRFGQPEELVGAAVFLASDAASFITGEVIVVDGGFMASGTNS
jgi:NAD(P)-dependent dehydrogenase (short-subunit alcohol dehydrogenase family)